MLARSLGRALRHTTQVRATAGHVGGLASTGDPARAWTESPPIATQRAFSILPERFTGGGGAASAITYLESALGLATEHALVSRLATVWGVPGECLMAQVASVRSLLLHPCELGTTAHALWMLVRCPELRTCSEAQIRSSVRRLQQAVGHLDLDRSTLLAAVYLRPWMLAAMLQPPDSSQAGRLARSGSWRQDLAAFVLEMRHSSSISDSSSGGSISGAAARARGGSGGSGGVAAGPLLQSTMLPLAVVKAYLAFKEAGAAARAVFKGPATRPQAPSSSSSSNTLATAHAAAVPGDASSQLLCEQHTLASDLSEASATAPTPTAAASDGGGVRYDMLLQQILVSYPQAVQLPPELLLSRCQLLGSGLQQGGGAAAVDAVESLVTSCPYLLLSPSEVHSSGGDGRPPVISSDFL